MSEATDNAPCVICGFRYDKHPKETTPRCTGYALSVVMPNRDELDDAIDLYKREMQEVRRMGVILRNLDNTYRSALRAVGERGDWEEDGDEALHDALEMIHLEFYQSKLELPELPRWGH
jgi:hypothetical protein